MTPLAVRPGASVGGSVGAVSGSTVGSGPVNGSDTVRGQRLMRSRTGGGRGSDVLFAVLHGRGSSSRHGTERYPDSASPAPIDRLILEFLQTSLEPTQRVERTTISDAGGHLELSVQFTSRYYPEPVEERTLSVRWCHNDDFKILYHETLSDGVWRHRWDRHPNPHNTPDYFHPPPAAQTPIEDASWPTYYRDMLRLVLIEIEERITQLREA